MNNRDDSDLKRRKLKMIKELVRNAHPRTDEKKLSPVEEALKEFERENGYKFLEMTNNPKVRQKHKLKQMQKKDYDDNDFLERFQDLQGD